jgi:hypothetical protein
VGCSWLCSVLKNVACHPEPLIAPLPFRNADVAEQIEHLRGHLLRSEQDNELMRVKLEEEKAEREKAQKQAELAKKMMLQQGREESGFKKHNRRETWCPGGKSGWAPPPMSAGAQQAVLHAAELCSGTVCVHPCWCCQWQFAITSASNTP